jgi:hypothetical protein
VTTLDLFCNNMGDAGKQAVRDAVKDRRRLDSGPSRLWI